MTSTTWTSAPAGLAERGTDVRPYPGVIVCPTPDAGQGTGLPFAAEVRGVFGADAARLRPLHGPVAVLIGADVPAAQAVTAQKSTAQQSTQNDGTTLGIHPPGRPQS